MPSLKAITIQEIDLFNARLLSNFSKLSNAQYFKLVNDEFYKIEESKASSSRDDVSKSSKDSYDRRLLRAVDRKNLEGNNANISMKTSSEESYDRCFLRNTDRKILEGNNIDNEINNTSSSKRKLRKSNKDSDRSILRLTDQNLEGNNVDFTDHFLRLVETPLDFCVSHEDLYKYGVVSNSDTTSKIVKLLRDTHGFEEGLDYQILNEMVNEGGRGQNNKKVYMMTPDVFKICLMRCRNTKRYANHYLKFERVHVYYQRYEKAYLNHIINGKDDKIDELKADLKEQARLAEIERQEAKERDRLNNEKFNELLRITGTTLNEIGEIKDICKDTDIQLGEIVDVVDTISTNIKKVCSTDVRGALADVEEKTEFILIQHETNLNAFKFLRGKKAYNDNKLKKTYSNYNVVKRDYDANPMTLFNSIKSRVYEEFLDAIRDSDFRDLSQVETQEAIDELKKVSIKNINITLINGYTPKELYHLIDVVINEKYNALKKTNELAEETKEIVSDTTTNMKGVYRKK
jgi:hypothetical protein